MKRFYPLLFGLVALLSAARAQDLGRIDTVGGTTHDWQTNGHGGRRIVNLPGQGIYVVWMYSASMSTSFPDRNMRCNYYDFATRAWNWSEPDFMQSGMNVFPVRAGYGNLAVRADGKGAFASAHVGTSTMQPAIAGLPSDSMSSGPGGYGWPVIAAGTDSTVHVAVLGYPTNDTVYYCRAWDSVIVMGKSGYPVQNIAASGLSSEVVVTWTDVDAPNYQYPAYYRRSSDGGRNWGPVVTVDPPPAFGPDSFVAFSPYGLFPYFGGDDRLHLAVSVFPVVGGTAHMEVGEIWHWCPDNTPQWAEVNRVSCEPAHLLGGFGYNALFCDRPSLGEDDDGNLYVVWEQFDSSNVETATGMLRAGIWVSSSSDQGITWQPGRLITARTTASHRYPCVLDRQIDGGAGPDTVVFAYECDEVAGFWLFGVGPFSFNPIVCQFWTTGDTVATGVGSTPEYGFAALGATVVRGVLFLPKSASPSSSTSWLQDVSGRKVMSLTPGANDVRALAPGVYFVREEPQASSHKPQAVRKVVVTR